MSPDYLAGLFDGEGTFYLGFQKSKNKGSSKTYPKAQVLLAQSGPEGLDLFERIQSKYGGNIYKHLTSGEHKATKDAYKMWWNKEEARLLIKQLLPFLILKQQAARDVLGYLERNKE